MTKKKVLFTGIDPKLIDSSMVTTAGWDASRVQAAAQDANKKTSGTRIRSANLSP